MKARNSVQSMAQSYQLGLAQVMEEICTKINIVSDRFHLIAGLFREVNCDKGGSEVSTGNKRNKLNATHFVTLFSLFVSL